MSCSGNMTMALNSTCDTVRLSNILSSTATSACSDSYTYTTTTGNYYGYTVPAGMFPGSGSTYGYTVPAGMLPESMPAWPGNPDVPSRKYIHDRMVSQTYPDGVYEVCYIDNARKVRYQRLFSPQEQNTHWITELIEQCIDEIQAIYRAKAEGEDTNMPITLSNEQIRKMLGLDEKPSYTDGYPTPKPVKVETYNDRVVKVTFEDGSFTKSVCSDNDTFDLDVGITICILKRVMGKNGHKLYNNMMRDIHKIMDENEKDKEKARKEKAERKAKQRKTEFKAAAKKAKARQDQIDIQKTAFVEALRVSGIGSGDDLK